MAKGLQTQTAKSLAALQKKIDAEVLKISKSRDALREYVEEITAILENADTALDELADSKRSMERAADVLSERL